MSVQKFLSVFLSLQISVTAAAMPTFKDVQSGWRSSDSWLTDRHGEPLSRMRVDIQSRKLSWVSLDQISPAFLQAVVQVEDRRFYAHQGVDWSALGAASLSTLRGDRRGGSTISMQLAGLLDSSLKPSGSGRSLWQKAKQIRQAQQIEQSWTKAQILEAYINLVPFRAEVQGIDAASRYLIGKPPDKLNRTESALLSSLLRSPNASPQQVADRVCRQIQQSAEPTPCTPIRQMVIEALSGQRAQAESVVDLAPELARRLLTSPGVRVRSSLDASLQRWLRQELRERIAELKDRNVRDASGIVIDNTSGEVLAWVGNLGKAASAPHVDGVMAPRQAGSTLKPFVYGLAIERQLLTPASLLEDSPVNLQTPAGVYMPQNYDHSFRGWVSVRTALASSLNIPAIRTIILTGYEPVYERLKWLGFPLDLPADHYGYGLALGVADVRLAELANAYRSLANNGIWSSLRFHPGQRPEDGKRVFSPATAFLVSHMLSDRAARNTTFSLENALATRVWSAVKTGTSKDMRDNWCIGFTERYTVGIWVGNADGEPMWDVSGVSGAAPAWLDTVNRLHANLPSQERPPPAGVVASRVKYVPSIEPARDEWFLTGTEMTELRLNQLAIRPRITYPGDGMIFATDQDIPVTNQAIRFEASAGENLRFRLNGVVIAPASHRHLWSPRPGRYQLELVNNQGKVFSVVHFQVRGAALAILNKGPKL
ncbi:penicillin-binding protein 1C [Parachitinimonas caeni]|nr:penicillin-binding protein 1C [Parachitinimonas caeni]